MPQSGYTGISFPFRVTSRGGVAMSTTSREDPAHILESVRQIFATGYLERPMEGGDVYSTAASFVFEPNDEGMREVLRQRMVDDLERLEERVECDEDDIEFDVEVDEDGVEYLVASVTFRVVKYDTWYTERVGFGGEGYRPAGPRAHAEGG